MHLLLHYLKVTVIQVSGKKWRDCNHYGMCKLEPVYQAFQCYYLFVCLFVVYLFIIYIQIDWTDLQELISESNLLFQAL